MKPIWVTSGEPAGIGPDICLALAGHPCPLVVLGDPAVLEARALQLGLLVTCVPYTPDLQIEPRAHTLYVYPVACPEPVVPGVLSPSNAAYVLQLLRIGAEHCLAKRAAALVTAPIHKAIINAAGIPFSGHTEFFAELTHTATVLMLLVSDRLRVSLVTTHLPLSEVSAALTAQLLTEHLCVLHATLLQRFGIAKPHIKVAGLNPHAGEGGYLGQEEQRIIAPVIRRYQAEGMNIAGPYAADTLFVDPGPCDAYVTMYHDQGLPVLKYASFGRAVNVTCGLPFIRTSVDHGTALDLAGSGRARPGSLLAAVALAAEMAQQVT